VSDEAALETKLEAYKQICENLRHYGNLRFNILTAFTVLSGALFTIALGPGRTSRPAFLYPCAGGIIIAVVFGLLEWRINRGLEGFADAGELWEKELKIHHHKGPLLRRSCFSKMLMPLMMVSIYIGAIVMWAAAGQFRNEFPKDSSRSIGHGDECPERSLDWDQ
jgi:hypothetical protein